LGGYREELFYMGEESDYCLRMLQAGYVTRLGRADPVAHHESAHRSTERMDFYGRRNDIIYAWQNVPMPYLPLHLGATILHGSVYAVRSARHPMRMFSGMFGGLAECFRGDFERRPVNSRIYR
jgi:GT2 family glycosyltransferase